MPLPNSTSFLLSFIFCVSSKSFSSSLAVDATAALIRMCTASDGLVRGCVCGFCCNQTRVAFRMAGRKRLNLTWQAISLLLASPSQDLLLWENSSDLQEQQHQDCSVQICTVLPLPVSHISHSSTSNHAQAGDKPVQMSSQPHVEYVCVGQTEPGQIGRKKKKTEGEDRIWVKFDENHIWNGRGSVTDQSETSMRGVDSVASQWDGGVEEGGWAYGSVSVT